MLPIRPTSARNHDDKHSRELDNVLLHVVPGNLSFESDLLSHTHDGAPKRGRTVIRERTNVITTSQVHYAILSKHRSQRPYVILEVEEIHTDARRKQHVENRRRVIHVLFPATVPHENSEVETTTPCAIHCGARGNSKPRNDCSSALLISLCHLPTMAIVTSLRASTRGTVLTTPTS